jgi:hypothetical protein
LPLLEGLPPASALEHLAASYPQSRSNRERRLEQILASPDPLWSPWLKETARYALDATGRAASTEGGPAVLSTLEKVIVLKGVDIFAETPDRVLADVASVCEPVHAAPGETVFTKGAFGDSLYVIVAGRVRVHDDAYTLNELGEGDVFGEMALLDPEPRVASVTALEDTQLLRLDQASFQELLEERSEIARSIIKVLTRRLRARIQDLHEAVAAREGARVAG